MNDTAVIIRLSAVNEDAMEFISLCENDGFGVIVAYTGEGAPEFSSGVIRLDLTGEDVAEAVRKAVIYVRDNSEYQNVALICEPSLNNFGELKRTAEEGLHRREALTVCSVGKYADDTIVSKVGAYITNTAYKFISGGKIKDLQPQIRCFSRCLFDSVISVRGRGEEYYLNMLIELPLNNIEVVDISQAGSTDCHRKRMSFFRLLRTLFPYAFVSRFVKFGLSSLFCFAIDYAILETVHFSLSPTNLPPPAVTTFSQITARVFSSSVNFLINYKIVFKSKRNLVSSAVKYYSNVCLILLLQMAIMAVFDSLLKISIIYTPFIVQAITFFINYNIQRRIVYRNKKNPL